MYTHMCICVCINTYTYTYIYIYREINTDVYPYKVYTKEYTHTHFVPDLEQASKSVIGPAFQNNETK